MNIQSESNTSPPHPPKTTSIQHSIQTHPLRLPRTRLSCSLSWGLQEIRRDYLSLCGPQAALGSLLRIIRTQETLNSRINSLSFSVHLYAFISAKPLVIPRPSNVICFCEFTVQKISMKTTATESAREVQGQQGLSRKGLLLGAPVIRTDPGMRIGIQEGLPEKMTLRLGTEEW